MKSFSMESKKNTQIKHKDEQNAEDMSTLDISVLKTLEEIGPVTRGKLVEKTGIPRSTLYDSLFRLMLKGLVKKYSDKNQNVRGRPQVYFEANP
ncbi:MAG: helix-turn-helix domain-containing protein [Candidatus Thorarchaeota archaeon]